MQAGEGLHNPQLPPAVIALRLASNTIPSKWESPRAPLTSRTLLALPVLMFNVNRWADLSLCGDIAYAVLRRGSTWHRV